ncbi:MAG: 4Fe-4S double cluster binding domain-containing protein [Kiritimatiellia bacterium]
MSEQPQTGKNPLETAKAVKKAAADIGYVECGITTADPFPEYAEAVTGFIDRFPETTDLYENMKRRAEPRAANSWARSIIVCVRRYGKYEFPRELAGHIGRNYLCDSRYAGNPEHTMPARMSEALKQMGLRIRRGGTPDRHAAARAGVVRIGRNGFAYHDNFGSWINILTWLADAELPPDEPTTDCPCPENCRICIDACPTGALCESFVMRMDRCIAYLTYHAPEPIPHELWEKIGGWIYGCDVCQTVCPLNRGKWQAKESMPWMKDILPCMTPKALAEMDDATYREKVHPAFWYISPENRARWQANANRALRQGARGVSPKNTK